MQPVVSVFFRGSSVATQTLGVYCWGPQGRTKTGGETVTLCAYLTFFPRTDPGYEKKKKGSLWFYQLGQFYLSLAVDLI